MYKDSDKCWLKGTIKWQLEMFAPSKKVQLWHQKGLGPHVWVWKWVMCASWGPSVWRQTERDMLPRLAFVTLSQGFLFHRPLVSCLLKWGLVWYQSPFAVFDIFEIITLGKADSEAEHLEQTETGIPVSSCCDEMTGPLTVTHGHQYLLEGPLRSPHGACLRNLQMNCWIMWAWRRKAEQRSEDSVGGLT